MTMLSTAAVIVGSAGAVVAGVLGQAAPDILNMPGVQYGALAILAFMVYTQSRERRQMLVAIEAKDKAILDMMRQMVETAKELAEATRRCRRANEGD